MIVPLTVALTLTYVASSAYLLRRPPSWTCHGNQRKRRVVRHISHRGGAAEGYENTIRNFHKAVKQDKTDMLELDCHLTADGHVVVLHDADLHRLTGVTEKVANLSLIDLPKIKATLSIDFVPNELYNDPSCSDSDRVIPTLESVFQSFPDIPINIDIKVHNQRLIQAVSDLIDKYDRHQITVWGNFKSQTTDECHRVNPKVGLLFSFKRVLQILVLYYVGLLPFIPIKETHFEIPVPSVVRNIHRNPQESKFKRIMLDFIVALLDKILLRKKLIRHLQLRGIDTYVWVLNSEDEFRKAFFDWGVTGVMTDCPSKLRRFLDQHVAKKDD